MMDLTEGADRRLRATRSAAADSCPTATTIIDFTPPWQRAQYADLFREHVGVAHGRRSRRAPRRRAKIAGLIDDGAPARTTT